MARHKWLKCTGYDKCTKCGAVRHRGFIPPQYDDADGKRYYHYAPPCDERYYLTQQTNN